MSLIFRNQTSLPSRPGKGMVINTVNNFAKKIRDYKIMRRVLVTKF